jgi:hypothetical protein
VILILTRLRLRLRRKKVPEIHYFHRKIREVPRAFLNLNLAILKRRIAGHPIFIYLLRMRTIFGAGAPGQENKKEYLAAGN